MKETIIFLLTTIFLGVVSSAKFGCGVLYFEPQFQCILECNDLGWEDGIHPGHTAADVAKNMTDSCGYTEIYVLQFSNCSFPNQRIEGDWFTYEKTPKFIRLYFSNSDLSSIEDNTVGKYEAFNKSLNVLSFTKTPNLAYITHGMMNDIHNPNESSFYLLTDGTIESVEMEAIAELSSNLSVLHMFGTGIQNVQSIANITGKCQPTTFDKIERVVYRYLKKDQGIPVFGRDLISAINSSELTEVLFDAAGIEYFEDNLAFEPFARQPNKLKLLDFDYNKLTSIPNGLFDPLTNLGQQINIYFGGNPWHCDGNLQYLQDVLIDDSDNLVFYDVGQIVCLTPDSQSGKLVIDADLTSGIFQTSPPVPRLDISCL